MEIDKDEIYWEQIARANWLQLRDKSLAYFHKCALARRRANTISKLVMDDGKEIDEGIEIMETASLFFQDLFKSKGVANPCKVLEGIEETISHVENEVLLSPFQEEEIQTALKGMGPIKAPGSDGFPALFFQRYWHIVGNDVIDYCLGILNDKKEIETFSRTYIVLIPKVQKPTKLVNFRPISLCTVIYKVVAKTIASRLQDVMDRCIDSVQIAFVPGRLILDNKRIGKRGFMAVKLDMSKTYDRVEWDFIEEVMLKIGFAREWVDLIMRCVTTVSYAVNINGRRGSLFHPTRGLRQGDPLSPFLFLIYSEGLSSLMRTTKRKGLVRGTRASRQGPEISHLLFADDCVLFGEATSTGQQF
ncbi:reverse transcriptase [Gossypium australe]|uniref:Reverse transcriptase n=1 Tax=Gossypium australe TaxID=47621 RepID=A0A5B6VS37_9ROSI|nr:reverse transcriptase [Gossypium australe]